MTSAAAGDGELAGQVAVVTGGGSGLGAAIARRLSADGAHVVVLDVHEASATEVAREVNGEPAIVDVSDADAVDAAIDGVMARHGRLDVLVNNAGIFPDRPEVRARGMANLERRMAGQPVEPVAATSTLATGVWRRMLAVHLDGTFFGTRAALRHMEPAGSGAIVNMASIGGVAGIPGAPDYSAAKGGIIAFSKSVAGEVAPLGIRVNCVAPAYIDTPFLADVDEVQKGFLTFRTPLGRLGRAEEVAAAVRFLAGPEASYCVGECLNVTGGFA